MAHDKTSRMFVLSPILTDAFAFWFPSSFYFGRRQNVFSNPGQERCTRLNYANNRYNLIWSIPIRRADISPIPFYGTIPMYNMYARCIQACIHRKRCRIFSLTNDPGAFHYDRLQELSHGTTVAFSDRLSVRTIKLD